MSSLNLPPAGAGTAAPARSATPREWGAVLALTLGAFALVASEFMPISLLTPIATDLQVSEGQAGQAIAVSGAFALVTSLLVSPLAGQLDRKWLLLGLTTAMILSGTLAALAPSFPVFMLGRALIGVAIGGFWAMSAATAMRLVPSHQVPRALAIAIGATVGGVLLDHQGYRATFWFSAVLLLGSVVTSCIAARSAQHHRLPVHS